MQSRCSAFMWVQCMCNREKDTLQTSDIFRPSIFKLAFPLNQVNIGAFANGPNPPGHPGGLRLA